MKTTVFLGTAAATMMVAGFAGAQTLQDVQERGTLNCGVSTGLTGFSAPNANGDWEGFDVDAELGKVEIEDEIEEEEWKKKEQQRCVGRSAAKERDSTKSPPRTGIGHCTIG